MDQEFAAARARLGLTFSPGAPIDEKALFAGRTKQVRRLIDVVFQRGQHAIVYGERGVGKTSLVNTFHEFLQTKVPVVTCRVNCDGTDTFASIWKKLLTKLVSSDYDVALKRQLKSDIRNFVGAVTSHLNPGEVVRIFKRISMDVGLVAALDEIDRIRNEKAKALLADTIKALSDESVSATLLLVGVADNVDALISEHESIRRSLVQIPMPRMSQKELEEIVTKGLEKVDFSISDDALYQIALMSRGLPHYTHLLGRHAGQHAAERLSRSVDVEDIRPAIKRALDDAEASVKRSYLTATATTSERPTLYPDVLLACALAPVDEMGFFTASKVKQPLQKVTQKSYDVPAFAKHMDGLCKENRDCILEKVGSRRRFRYRFRDPLMQPYIVLKAYSQNRIDWENLNDLEWTFDVEPS